MNEPKFAPLEFNEFAEVCYNAHIAFCLDKFPSSERALEHFYIEHLNARAALAAQPGSVGEVLLIGGDPDLKEVAWTNGKMPAAGTKLYAAPTEAKPAQQDAVDASIPLDKGELAQLIAEHLGGTYHCNRVWEAWNVGTMRPYDFEPVDESETPTKIAEAIIDAIRAAISAKKGGA